MDKSTACKQTDIQSSVEPNGSKDPREKDDVEVLPHHKNEFHIKLGGIRIFDLCSEDMQMYLLARTHGTSGPTPHDIDCAVQAMLPELGINRSAWTDACAAMGRDKAAMCLILTDANRNHPQLPVRNPGGYSRGMTRAYRAGELNIMGSLIALSQRCAEGDAKTTDIQFHSYQ